MTPDEVLQAMKAEMTRPSRPRTFAGGLLPAFCNFFLELGQPAGGYASWDDFVARHPLASGQGINTLTVMADGGTTRRTIRPAYNAIQRFYVHEHHRLDYPSAAPHATGQWRDYQPWLDSLVTFTPAQLEQLREDAKAFVLGFLKEVVFDPSTVVVDPPIFRILIEQFPWTERRGHEKTGAAFQAMVFAYIRADAPHLQVETRKVRTGSSRLKGIGDIDAWEGKKLTISVEVKHFVFNATDLEEIEQFVQKVRQRGALGLVVATDFAAGVREDVATAGLVPLAVEDLVRIVTLWDPVKQRAALNAFEWAIVQKEQSTGLIERFNEFLIDVGYRPAVAVAADPEPRDEIAGGTD